MKYLQEVFFSNLNVSANNGGYIFLNSEMPWHIENHRFNQNKFYCIINGNCKIVIEGKEYNARQGDWFFIPANAQHCYSKSNTEHLEKFWLHFDIYPSDCNLFRLLDLAHVVHIEKNDPAMDLFNACAVADCNSLPGRLHLKACLLLLLERYISLANPQKIFITNQSDERLNKVLCYINENIGETISNASLADLCHLNVNHFIRFFKIKTGQTPMNYIRRLKFETAKQLLESTDLSISEIALKIGIGDISYFSKQFKHFYAMSPRQYIKHFNQTRRDNTK